MADQTAESVRRGLLQGWIHRHGPPKIMLNNQGANVDGILVGEMLSGFGIEKRHSSPYHPECDDQTERGVQSVKQVMRCLLEDRGIEKDDWPSILQEVSYNLNCLSSSSTGYLPYTVMYGVKPMSPHFLYPHADNDRVTAREWLEEVTNAKDVVNSDVNSNLSESRAKMKSNYRSSYSPTNVEAGDMVLLKNEPRSRGLEPCLLALMQ